MKNIYDLCETVGEWENKYEIPCDRRLTEWYGDMNMFVPLPGVTDEQIQQRERDIADGKEVWEILKDAAGHRENIPNILGELERLHQKVESSLTEVEMVTTKPSQGKRFRPLTYNSHIFIGTKPAVVEFPGGHTISVKKWREAALAILKDCNADPQCHENLLALRDSGVISGPQRRILWADPSSMDTPMEIGPSLYFEGHFGTEYLLKMLCRTLELVGYDYRNVRFQLREREEPSL